MMAKQKTTQIEVVYRQAEPSDATIAGRLLFDTFPRLATFLIGLGQPEQAKKILTRLFAIKGHRFSFEYAQMALVQGKVVGLTIGFPGKKLRTLNRRMGRLLIRQYRMRGKFALILRAWPLVFIKEAGRDEFLLSHLAVKKRFRNKGIGGRILTKVEEKAKESGLRKISLMVSIENQDARRFYERNGYKVKAFQLESNKRVRYLGPGYQRMVKEL